MNSRPLLDCLVSHIFLKVQQKIRSISGLLAELAIEA